MLKPSEEIHRHTPNHSALKVAVVHDWLVIYGGAERVMEHILDCYPQADLFSLIDYVPEEQRHFLRGKTPKTSFLQRIPGVAKHYPKLLPLMPLAIEQFDLSSYDLVISSSYCVAKGVLNGPNQTHVSYCHSPMRYAWDHYHEYLSEMNLNRGLKSWIVRGLLHNIRTWDTRSSNMVDNFIANSNFVQARIKKFYGRESELIYPPVDTQLFSLNENKEDFYVAAGRFAPFKRLDLVVDAFNYLPDRKLVLIGDGPEMAKLKSKAGDNVEFLGFQPPEVMRDYLSRAKAFIFPSEEDFGIVPVEAQACGTPVIAFGSGGALETVIPANSERAPELSTGLWFARQSPDSLAASVLKFEALAEKFDPTFISRHAAKFAPDQFKAKLVETVDRTLTDRHYKPEGCSDDEHTFRKVRETIASPIQHAKNSKFGVPISANRLEHELGNGRLIAAISRGALERAGDDRDFQFMLNQFDSLLPLDQATAKWAEIESCENDFSSKGLQSLCGYDCTLVADNETNLWPSPLKPIILSDDPATSEQQLPQLLRGEKRTLIFADPKHVTLTWITRHRTLLHDKQVICVFASNDYKRARGLSWLNKLKPVAKPNRWWRRHKTTQAWKRGLDILGSSMGMLVLSPLLLGVALLIKLESKGPVIFTQDRVGVRGKTFKLYKFRSMFPDAEQRLAALKDQNESSDGVLFKMRKDPRITTVGRIIRRLSIDELPQLLNVLRGEMTLVGPRPALPREVAEYSPTERKRLQLKPGLTCLWQVNGRSDIPFNEQVELDLTYASQQSPVEDMSILVKTIPAVISGKGAY